MLDKKFTIEKAKKEDLNDILNLNSDLFKKEYKDFDDSMDLDWTSSKEGQNYFSGRISNSEEGCLYVAKFDKKVIGYLCGGIGKTESYRKEAKCAELENMFVKEKFRNQRIGEKLVEKFINWCKEKLVDHASVTASVQNSLAINFYKKSGFEEYNLVLEMKLKNKHDSVSNK
ncbi:GNAT family N-acetyltransferase [bacterium]|nr:MAG: GNAT family N-acetyltransferase [bacterium]